MKNFLSANSLRAFEKLGVLPRSIIRTLLRFTQQIFQKPTNFILYEYRFSKYQIIACIKCFVTLICIPYCIHQFIHQLVVYLNCFNVNGTTNFVNSSKYEIYELSHAFKEQVFFDTLLNYPCSNLELMFQMDYFRSLHADISKYINLVSDLSTLFIFIGLMYLSSSQLIIVKSFIVEFIYNLTDTTKSFFLILSTDLIVGFHSSRAWELVLISLFHHFGFSTETNFLYLIISIFPVFIDTLFKYWIFRYLNKISPSTVATYQNMIE